MDDSHSHRARRAILIARGKLPVLLSGAILFVSPLIPVLGLKPFDFQQYSTVADHYLYIPMIGVALIVATMLARLKSQAVAIAIGAIFCIALAIGAFDQTKHWRNSETLWTHTMAPESG